MDTGLIVTLVGLALLDSINTSTLFLVMVILLTARRPVAAGSAYAIGAAAMFFALALALFFGANAAESAIAGAAMWIRRGTFALLAVFLFYLAYKRLRDRPRKPFELPQWFGPISALPIGAAATIADLPNAFPLLIAIERLVTFEIPPPAAAVTLGAYTCVYALPTVVLLVVGAVAGDRIRGGLHRVTSRFFSGTAKRSLPIAGLFALGGIGSAVLVAVV